MFGMSGGGSGGARSGIAGAAGPRAPKKDQHTAATGLDGRAAFLQALAVLKAGDREQAEAEGLFARVFARLDPLHETGRVRWAELLRFVLGWAYHKRPAAERPRWHDLAVGLQATADRKREIDHMGQTIAPRLIQEGREEGLRTGR